MADNHIRFHIGSAFSGEGFKKAQAAVSEVNKTIKTATGASMMLSTAMGQMDNSASKAMKAMTGIVGAFLTGGPAAAILAAGMTGINEVCDRMMKKVEGLTERMNKMHEAVERSFSGALNGRMNELKKEISSISDDFERITKQANQFAAALEGVRSAEASGGIINLQVEKLNALLAAHSDEERANIEAAYNLKIAVQKSADSEIAWKQKTEAAHQAVVDSENRKATVEKQLAAVEEERASLEQTMAAAKASDDEHYLEIQKKVNELKTKEAELSQKILDTESETDILRVKEQQVKQEAINAQGEATIAIRNAELAEVKLTEAKHNRQVKEEAAFDAAWEKQQADLLDAEKVKTAAQIQDDANKAARDLAAAEREYEAALKYYAENVTKVQISQAAKDGTLGKAPDAKDRQNEAAKAAVAKGIQDGTIRNSRQQHDAEMKAMRAQRDAESGRDAKQEQRDQQRADRIEKMGEKARSKQDQKFLDDFKQRQKQKDEDARKLQEAKDKIDKGPANIEKIKKTIEDIKKTLDNKLGIQ